MTARLATVDISSLFDTAATDPSRVACREALHQALRDTGFAVLQGTGVAPEVLENMRQAVKAVFDAPRSRYQGWMVDKNNYRGYVPLAYFTPNAGGARADQYEAWKLHWEVDAKDPICEASALYGPNRWPPLDFDVRSAVQAYWAEMTRVNDAILKALCEALGIDPAVVLAMMERPLTNMTLLNYPPGRPHDDSWGIHPHKDFNFLTLLAHDPVGGLEVRTQEGAWIEAQCAEQEYVLNVGDMLELLTGGRLVSTPHRVTNRSARQRQSFPYFSVPRFDVLVAPLLPPVPGFQRSPLQSGAASHDIWYSNWPDEAVTDAAIDLGNYAD
ncbi:MAG: 2OG-Fe(II) oxygenase family protein [Rhodoferax sp.]|nr:2OG-Fe(II) oxygenase family protein [Rhodoferax sp.]